MSGNAHTRRKAGRAKHLAAYRADGRFSSLTAFLEATRIAELLAQATERVAAAWRYERAVEAWERSGWRNVEVDGKVEGRRTTHPVPDPQWISRTPSDMQRAVACSATSVPEAVEALREGLWEFWLMNMVSGR